MRSSARATLQLSATRNWRSASAWAGDRTESRLTTAQTRTQWPPASMLASAWVSRAFRLAAATYPAVAPAACLGSSPDESKLFGLAHNDAVANTSRERQHQERAGQTSHNAPRASPADDLLPGES